jgi:hypothetical protein|tara:strand:+ start:381 stop:548 length:168 start_codon:yes stop_codon:yes gene_type:complete
MITVFIIGAMYIAYRVFKTEGVLQGLTAVVFLTLAVLTMSFLLFYTTQLTLEAIA